MNQKKNEFLDEGIDFGRNLANDTKREAKKAYKNGNFEKANNLARMHNDTKDSLKDMKNKDNPVSNMFTNKDAQRIKHQDIQKFKSDKIKSMKETCEYILSILDEE